jgi:hypothetical protein
MLSTSSNNTSSHLNNLARVIIARGASILDAVAYHRPQDERKCVWDFYAADRMIGNLVDSTFDACVPEVHEAIDALMSRWYAQDDEFRARPWSAVLVEDLGV